MWGSRHAVRVTAVAPGMLSRWPSPFLRLADSVALSCCNSPCGRAASRLCAAADGPCALECLRLASPAPAECRHPRFDGETGTRSAGRLLDDPPTSVVRRGRRRAGTGRGLRAATRPSTGEVGSDRDGRGGGSDLHHWLSDLEHRGHVGPDGSNGPEHTLEAGEWHPADRGHNAQHGRAASRHAVARGVANAGPREG